MRRPKGLFLPPVHRGRLRRRELHRALRAAVLDGVLPPGERLPSTRQAAADYGVSRGMLEEVYAQLADEGFIERTVGRGTFVAPRVAALGVPAKAKPGARRSAVASRRGQSVSANAACREPEVPRPFNAGLADTSEFPFKLWSRLQARAARELGQSALSFADPRGLPRLRASVARYLAQFRGIRCDPSQVVVFNSAQQALNALAVLLLDRGDAVWLEDPCYLGARAAFELAGAALLPVPVDDEGIRVDVGIRRAPRARLAYVTPPHQYPTGVALSLERRISLLEWAARGDAWIVEDDYLSELQLTGRAAPALASLDHGGRVVHIGSFSKTISPALRLGFVVAPIELTGRFGDVCACLAPAPALALQGAVAEFLREGHYIRHLRRMSASTHLGGRLCSTASHRSGRSR
jgi:GntR family transcriptional regulator/MocR family aminotransferase